MYTQKALRQQPQLNMLVAKQRTYACQPSIGALYQQNSTIHYNGVKSSQRWKITSILYLA